MSKLYSPSEATHSGVCIEYTKSRQELYIDGWYDGCVGIEGRRLSLTALCRALGITAADLKHTIKDLAQ